MSWPADVADLRRNKALGRVAAGRSRARGRDAAARASWQFVAHVTNGETGEVWVEVVGGRAGDRAVRSFRPDQLYAADRPAGS